MPSFRGFTSSFPNLCCQQHKQDSNSDNESADQMPKRKASEIQTAGNTEPTKRKKKTTAKVRDPGEFVVFLPMLLQPCAIDSAVGRVALLPDLLRRRHLDALGDSTTLLVSLHATRTEYYLPSLFSSIYISPDTASDSAHRLSLFASSQPSASLARILHIAHRSTMPDRAAEKKALAEFIQVTQTDKNTAAKYLKQHNYNAQAAANA